MSLENTPEISARLQSLAKERKFEEDIAVFYPGAPSEDIRVACEGVINSMIESLLKAQGATLDKAYVLRQLEKAGQVFKQLDSEELERALTYMEEVMDIYGIESSDGLLNRLRYGM